MTLTMSSRMALRCVACDKRANDSPDREPSHADSDIQNSPAHFVPLSAIMDQMPVAS